MLSITGRDKVILVGHSMGGLASRQYLQNSSIWQTDGNHHVAKLLTIGTPHGGSNQTFGPLSPIAGALGSVNELSEAVRDLRYSYYTGSEGAYLFGGTENTSTIYGLISPFCNVDVNCNGAIGNNIVGLNYKNISTDLAYSCIIGDGSLLGGDGVVDAARANLNNYYNLGADTFVSRQPSGSTSIWHIQLPKQTDFIEKGIDEANDYDKSYGIVSDEVYFGKFTVQSLGGAYTIDYDDFKFSVPTNQMLNLKVYNLPLGNCKIEILDYSYNSIYSTNSNGQGSLNINTPINAGNYYFEVSATADNVSWYYPYALKLSFTGNGVCPTSNIALKADIVGSTYQWQMNTGSGYFNITDSNIYSGSTTSVLQLNSPPTSWYGYGFRCLVNGATYSQESTLKFSVRWTGAVSTAWENPLNWNCGILPDNSTDVIVNSGTTYYPQVNSNAFCRSLSVSPTTSIIIKSGANLTITK